MQLTIYTANCCGKKNNTIYPNKCILDNEDDFRAAIAYDHVCAEYRKMHRSNDDFMEANGSVMDNDNDHSDNPEDWIYPEDYDELFPDVAYIVSPSRHNMKVMNISKALIKARKGAIMKIEYIQSGDFQIPNLTANKEPEGTLTKYGLMRRNFLKNNRRGVYSGMLLKGTLKEHCLTIQEQADQRMDLLTEQMAKDQGVDEQMKRTDQMKWVGLMNNIRASAEEIVLSELIYS